MAEPGKLLYKTMNAPDPQTGVDRPYFQVHSTAPDTYRTPEELDAAFRIYHQTGQSPPGYTVMPVHSAATSAGQFFDRLIGQPLRNLEADIRRSPDVPSLAPIRPESGAPAPGESDPLMRMLPEGLRRSLLPVAQKVLAPVSEGVPGAANVLKEQAAQAVRQAQTPEGLGSLVGQVAGTIASGGMSTIPAALVQAGTTFLGRYGGDLLAGTEKHVGKALAEASLAAASRGAQGFIQWLASSGVDKQAEARVLGKVQDVFEQQYPHLKGHPDLTNYAMSNKDTLTKTMNVLIDDMREQVGTLVNATKETIESGMPRALSRVQRPTFDARIRALQNASTEYINNLNDAPKLAKSLTALDDAIVGVGDFLDTEFPNSPSLRGNATVALLDYKNQLARQSANAQVIRAAERSGMQYGWSNEKFMQEVGSYYKDNPDTALEAAGNMVQRGMEQLDPYQFHIPSIGPGLPGIGKVRLTPDIPLGEVYGGGMRTLNVGWPQVLGQLTGTRLGEQLAPPGLDTTPGTVGGSEPLTVQWPDVLGQLTGSQAMQSFAGGGKQ